MRYTEAVAEARQLVKRSEADQWRLAELTAEVLARGKSTRDWAADVGVSQTHVIFLGKIWAAYGDYQVIDRPPFANAYAEVKGMPLNRAERRENEALSNLRKAPVTKRAEAVKEFMADESVREHVLRDRQTRSAVRETDHALIRAAADTHRAAKIRESVDEGLEPLRDSTIAGQISTTLDDLRRMTLKVADLIRQRKWSGEAQVDVLDRLAELRVLLDGCESYVNSGDLDEELVAILQEGM